MGYNYTQNVPWSFDEVEALKAHYAKHGSNWVGWESILPGRTPRAIGRKANAIGLKMEEGPDRKAIARKIVAKRKKKAPVCGAMITKDPFEAKVLRMMEDGMTPSQIDKVMRWRPGKASLILSHMWSRESDGKRR